MNQRVRKIAKDFQVIGRRFKKGDIVIFDKDTIYHVYTDDDSLEPDILISEKSNINQCYIDDIMENSYVK